MNRHARPGTIRRALADAFGAACIFGLLWAALIVTP
jgi:hypothetical protein